MDVHAAMGRVGLPAPVSELAGRDWDAVVIGGGHNGLTAAAYLAQAGQSVLVLERRDQLGGACTLERPFEDEGYVVSPCAYVVGLLDERVVDELELKRHGYRVFPTDPGLWCPFADGTSIAEFRDDERTAAYMRAQGFAEREVDGAARLRGRLRPLRASRCARASATPGLGSSPSRERARGDAGRRRGADRRRVRGVDRRRCSSATSATERSRRALRPGRHRRLGRARATRGPPRSS